MEQKLYSVGITDITKDNIVKHYYNGCYAEIGDIENGVNLPNLPSLDDYLKSLSYYVEWSEEEKTETITKIRQFEELDENGDTIQRTEKYTEEVPYTEIVCAWSFDEDRYNELVAEIEENTEPTAEQEIATLKAENEELQEKISTMDNTLELLMLDILPSLKEAE